MRQDFQRLKGLEVNLICEVNFMENSVYDKQWIIEHGIKVLETYDGQITLRQLYYRLVSIGMTNDAKHYKKVIAAMTDARWNETVDFGAFIDRERSMFGETKSEPTVLVDEEEEAKEQIESWMKHYSLNKWENQPEYVEVWIEKKALQGVFEMPCQRASVGLAPCKGYPSLTFLNEARERFNNANTNGQNPTILYFGDFDPSGEDIPRSISENLFRMGCDVNVEKIALNQKQITRMRLPSAPAKATDSRARNWDGAGVVELDAVEPSILAEMVTEIIKQHFDENLYSALKEREATEREQYQEALKLFVGTL